MLKQTRIRVWIGASVLFGLSLYVDEIKSFYQKYVKQIEK